MSLNGITGKPSLDKSLGTAFTASSSSPNACRVYVSDGSTVPGFFDAHPQKMATRITAIIAECLGDPRTTSQVCQAWRAGTEVAYKREALATFPRDQYSLALLKLATQRVFPVLTAAYTPEEYRKLDYTTCQTIHKNIKIIQDENLIRFFDRVLLKIPPGSRPTGLPENIHEKAKAIRRWMAIDENRAILSLITSLNLTKTGLEILPPEVGQLTGLKELRLVNNRLVALPDSIGQLTVLLHLTLSNNRLETLPDSIGQLTALLHLTLNNNRLETLPDSIGQLVKLQTLMLTKNRLRAVPNSIGQLAALRDFLLDNNHLAVVPDCIRQLAALRCLFLQHNPLLAVLPEWLDQLHLEKLFLSSDQPALQQTSPERCARLNVQIYDLE